MHDIFGLYLLYLIELIAVPLEQNVARLIGRFARKLEIQKRRLHAPAPQVLQLGGICRPGGIFAFGLNLFINVEIEWTGFFSRAGRSVQELLGKALLVAVIYYKCRLEVA